MSKEQLEVEPYYENKARELIDLLVDKGFIRDDVSRAETRVLEEYIGYLFQSTAESSAKTALLLRKYNQT